MKKIVARMKDSTLEINGDQTDTKGEPMPDLSAWVSWSKTPDRHPWDTLRKSGWTNARLADAPQDDWVRWYKPETDEDRLHIECATYDWFYHMSDDGRVYDRGYAQDRRIQALFQKVPDAQRIWRKYVVRTLKSMVTNEDGGLFFLESYFNAFGGGS